MRSEQDGTLYVLRIPDAASAFQVKVRQSKFDRSVVLRVADQKPRPWFNEAKRLRAEGKADEALRVARVGLDAPDPSDRAYALGLLARIELSKGKSDAAISLLRQSTALFSDTEEVSQRIDDTFALVFALTRGSRKYTEARHLLNEVSAIVAQYPEGAAREPHYRGIVAQETGDSRIALQMFEEASRRAARLGMSQLHRMTRSAHAIELRVLRRPSETANALRSMARELEEGDDVSACERASWQNSLGYAWLLEAEYQGPTWQTATLAQEALDALEKSLSLCRTSCQDRYLRTAVLENLGLAALLQGNLALCRSRIQEAKNSVSNPRGMDVLFWTEMEARIALASGQPAQALKAYERESELAFAAMLPHEQWRAMLGKGVVLEGLGRLEEAASAYAYAENLLRDQSLLIPLGEGRDVFLGNREQSAQRRVNILLRLGRTKDAMLCAREARARILGTVQSALRLETLDINARATWDTAVAQYRKEREEIDREAANDWKLPENEFVKVLQTRKGRERKLRAAFDDMLAALGKARTIIPNSERLKMPSTGELFLLYHPLPNGWIGFAADTDGVSAFHLDAPAPDQQASELSRRLLEPARAKLQHAKRIVVFPYGPLRDIDFHALPWDGSPLLALSPVEIAVDLAMSDSPTALSGKGTALVVSDPRGDLVAAHAEGEIIKELLTHNGHTEVMLLDGPQATSTALGAKLREADLLHYAGHGEYAGHEGWESSLPLAAEGRLSIGDILALPRVPRWVVLSGCQTAKSSSTATPDTFGLAQAFVVAGAQSVIAPVRKIPDNLALRVSVAIHTQLGQQQGTVDLALALRDALLNISAQTPNEDWAALRVLRP